MPVPPKTRLFWATHKAIIQYVFKGVLNCWPASGFGLLQYKEGLNHLKEAGNKSKLYIVPM